MNEGLKKILYVFTKEYRKEIEYEEFMKKNLENFKFNSDNYDAEEKILTLKKRNFHSNFSVKLDYEDNNIVNNEL